MITVVFAGQGEIGKVERSCNMVVVIIMCYCNADWITSPFRIPSLADTLFGSYVINVSSYQYLVHIIASSIVCCPCVCELRIHRSPAQSGGNHIVNKRAQTHERCIENSKKASVESDTIKK